MNDARRSPEDDPDTQWARISAELTAYRARRREAWGDLDDIALARYLAGEATEAEAERVHRAMDEHPKVRECVAIVRELAAQTVTAEAETATTRSTTIPFHASTRKSPRKRRVLLLVLSTAASLFIVYALTLSWTAFRAFDRASQAALKSRYSNAQRRVSISSSPASHGSVAKTGTEPDPMAPERSTAAVNQTAKGTDAERVPLPKKSPPIFPKAKRSAKGTDIEKALEEASSAPK